ncbi:MAG TPA: hypothetical protein VHF47_03660, partial [Acidimicrobiales bacterium]|nr:hypothetical protein [Acidimicrobiales bacterium]
MLRLPRRPAALLLLLPALASAGCRDGTVRVSFRPEVGAQYAYRVRVAADVVTRIADRPVRRTTDEDVFTARHKVLAAGRAGSRVEVRLESDGQEPRTFVVRLDRAGQLAEVQRIEGFPADVLGGLGLSEIFPAAAGALPDRPLAPGDRWTIDEAGTGRLARLGVVDGRRRATVESDYVLPVARTTSDGERPLRLEGDQRTRATSSYDLRDGAVEHVVAET